MNNALSKRPLSYSQSGVLAFTATVAASFVLLLATVACGANAGNSDGIPRADISDLPTPTGGEIFASADEVVATESVPENQEQGGALFEGSAGVEGTIIEDLVAQNPEIAGLIQKVRSGSATDADLERLNTLLNEAFAQGGPLDLGASPIAGSIQAVNGNQIEIQSAPDEEGNTPPPSTVTVGDDTQILVASEIVLADIELNTDVDVVAIRGADGIIRARTVTVADINDAILGAAGPDGDGAQSFGRRSPFGGPFGAAPPGGVMPRSGPGQRQGTGFGAGQQPAQDDTNSGYALNQPFDDAQGIPAQGRVTNIEDARIHIETDQGPLRVTIDDQTEFVRIASGTVSDIAAGLAAFTFADTDGIAIMIMVGPEHLLDTQGAGFDVLGP